MRCFPSAPLMPPSPAHPHCPQYTWIFALAVIVGFFESYGIGANDLVRAPGGAPRGMPKRRLDSHVCKAM